MPSENERYLAQLVVTAITNLNERNGSTIPSIREYICDEYQIPKKEARNLKKILQRGVAFGALSRQGHKFQIGEVMEPIAPEGEPIRTRNPSNTGSRNTILNASRSRSRSRPNIDMNPTVRSRSSININSTMRSRSRSKSKANVQVDGPNFDEDFMRKF